MAKTSKSEKIILTINGTDRRSPINSNRKVRQSEQIDIQDMLHRLERRQNRRYTCDDTSAVVTNSHTSCQKHYCHQLAERVRELEKEIVPDLHYCSVGPTYSPYSALTPCSNNSANGFSNYPRPQNFPMNLLSPNSSVPIQRFGLSSKILERAHEIPERFWIAWQQKHMQNRIEELEYIKNNLTSPNNIDVSNRRKSLLLLHELQRRLSARIIPTSIDTETSSSSSSSSVAGDHDAFTFDQRSIDSSSPKQSLTLDRSRLTISIPFSNTHQLVEKPIETMSSASSIEDVAQIDTELKLTLLSQENSAPLLYSRAILNRSIAFRSLSEKKDSFQ